MFCAPDGIGKSLPALYGLDAHTQIETIQEHFLDARQRTRLKNAPERTCSEEGLLDLSARAWAWTVRAGQQPVQAGNGWAAIVDPYSPTARLSCVGLTEPALDRAAQHIDKDLMGKARRRMVPAHAIYVRYKGEKVWTLVGAGAEESPYNSQAVHFSDMQKRMNIALESCGVEAYTWVRGYSWEYYQSGDVASILVCEGKLIEDKSIDPGVQAKVLEGYRSQRAIYLNVLKMLSPMPSREDPQESAAASLLRRLL